MLNELLIVERGAREAGIEMAQRHPDIKDARSVPTLLVRLCDDGHVGSVRPVPPTAKPWTLRDGQHNSFPFVQPKHALWLVPQEDERRRRALDKRHTDRWRGLIDLVHEFGPTAVRPKNWPGSGLLQRLHERRRELALLEGTAAAAVLASIDRFLLACEPDQGGDPQRLLQEITAHLTESLQQTAGTEWLDTAVAVLIEGSGAFLFDADSHHSSVLDRTMIGYISVALKGEQSDNAGTGGQRCGLTGEFAALTTTPFPQPNLPLLGQTSLFARNRDIPANGRYGRFGADTMPVGEDTAVRLAAAITALTAKELKGTTWRSIPGEAPKQTDLLLAFVETVPNAAVIDTFAGELAEDDYSDEIPVGTHDSSSVASFEKRTERLIDAVRANVGDDFRRTPVRLAVLRRVDPANRKVIYAETLTVGHLYSAAVAWAAGEQNIPPWLTLPVPRKGERNPGPMSPPHIAPFDLISFSKQLFTEGGAARQEITGLPAGEALGLFLDPAGPDDIAGRRRVRRVLRMVLARRGSLVSGTAHALRRGSDTANKYDRREALRTVTLLGVLLRKIAPPQEVYMSNAAFELGQFLAAADMVHAGYCADVRGGDVPPSLLGNQIFTMAQTAPSKALAVLCRRWKPYDGWAKTAARDYERPERLVRSNKKDEQQRGWDIRKALRHAREMRPLADALRLSLAHSTVDDTFRAELLLGYIAGLPAAQREDTNDNGTEATTLTEG